MNKGLDYDFSRLPDSEMEAKPVGKAIVLGKSCDCTEASKCPHIDVVIPYHDVESIPEAIVGGMRAWWAFFILGLSMVAVGVLIVVFGGGK